MIGLEQRSVTEEQRQIWRDKGRFYVSKTRPHLPDRDEYNVVQRDDPRYWSVMPTILGCYLTAFEAGALWRQLTNSAEARRVAGLED